MIVDYPFIPTDSFLSDIHKISLTRRPFNPVPTQTNPPCDAYYQSVSKIMVFYDGIVLLLTMNVYKTV